MKLGIVTHLDNAAQYRSEAKKEQIRLATEDFKRQLIEGQEEAAKRQARIDAETSAHQEREAARVAEQAEYTRLAALLSVSTKVARQAESKGKAGEKAAARLALKKQKASYKALVWKLTKAQDLSGLPNIHLRAWRKYDLDHIISIFDGFKRGLAPEAIASLDNLRIIPHKDNSDKGIKSHYDAHPLAGLLIARERVAKYNLC